MDKPLIASSAQPHEPAASEDQIIDSLELILNRLLQERFASSEGSGVCSHAFVLESSEQGLIAHRIQLWLGRGDIDQHTASNIAELFACMKQVAWKAYALSGVKVSEVRHVLVTTHNMQPSVRAFFVEQQIRVIGKDVVHGAMPDEVKALRDLFQD